MPPPRDRMAAMQQQAYLEDDDFHMDMNDEHDPAMQEFFRQIEVWKKLKTHGNENLTTYFWYFGSFDKKPKLQKYVMSGA